MASVSAAPPSARRVLAWPAKAVDAALTHLRASLAVLVIAQIVATVAFALSVTHNGWLYYQGGDQIWYATTGWSLGDLRIPNALVGYGWSLALAPITWATGPTFIQALPLITVVNVLVMGPIALLCVYAIAERIGGRLLGLWSALLWVISPYVAIPLFVSRYHERFVDQFLPQALGLTAMADYFSMVALLVAALFLLRSIERRSWPDALVSGVVMGIAGGAKPPNYLFLAGALLAYACSRRWREALVFGVSLGPALLTLLLWKYRGLGTVPLFALGETREALGSGAVVAQASVNRYVNIDWGVWKTNMSNLREFFVAARLVQWAPIAGAVIVVRRKPVAAGLLIGWLSAFLVVKGTSPLAQIEAGSFWRLLMPAWPAYLILAAAVPLLIPTADRRLGWRIASARSGAGTSLPIAVLAATTLALVPLAVMVLARPAQSPQRVVLVDEGGKPQLIPVDDSITVRTVRRGSAVELTWSTHAWRGGVSYRVLRSPSSGPEVACSTAGVTTCTLDMETLALTREQRYSDPSPPPGVTYRIGIAADYTDPQTGGDLFDVSRPVRPAN